MIEVKPEAELLHISSIAEVYRGFKQCVSWEVDRSIDWDEAEAFVSKRMQGCHESPLEHGSATFQITCSRACSHQLVRHRLASYSQMSQRYCEEDDDLKIIIPPSVAAKGKAVVTAFKGHATDAYKGYRSLIDNYGVAAEDARFLLPNAAATRLIVTRNFRDLIHFLNERLCCRAQWEIREIAEQMREHLVIMRPCIFENIGKKCERLGRCPEEKSCGWYAKHIKEEESK